MELYSRLQVNLFDAKRLLLTVLVLAALCANFTGRFHQALTATSYDPSLQREAFLDLVADSLGDRTRMWRFYYNSESPKPVGGFRQAKPDFFQVLSQYYVSYAVDGRAVHPRIDVKYNLKPLTISWKHLVLATGLSVLNGFYLLLLAWKMYLTKPQEAASGLDWIGVALLGACYSVGFFHWLQVSSPANLLKWEKSIFLGFYLFWAVSDFARYRLGQRAKKRETSHVSASGKSHDKAAFHNPRHHLMWGVVDLLMAVVVATFLFFGWSQGGSHAYFTGKDLAIFLTLLAWVGIYFYKYQAILNNEDKYVDNYTDYLQKTKEKGEKDELGHFKLMPWADKDRDTVRPLTENLPDEVRILDYGAGNGKRLKIFLDLLPTDKQYVLRGYDIRDWKDKWEKMFKDSGHNAKWLESDQAIDFHNYHIIFASNIFYQSEIRQNIITKFLQAADPARLLVVRGFDRGTMFHNAALASGLYDQYAWEAKTLELCEQSGLVCMARLPVAQRFLFHQLSGSPSYRMQCTVQMIEGVVCKSLNQHAGVALECMVARERGRCDGRPWQNVDMAGVTLPTDELYLFFGRPANESEARN